MLRDHPRSRPTQIPPRRAHHPLQSIQEPRPVGLRKPLAASTLVQRVRGAEIQELHRVPYACSFETRPALAQLPSGYALAWDEGVIGSFADDVWRILPNYSKRKVSTVDAPEVYRRACNQEVDAIALVPV